MSAQWNGLLQNLGEWQGSFTRLSPQGDLLEETLTMVSLEGLNHNQTIRQIVRRFTPEPEDKVLEYSSLGRGVLFFETGEFSQGSIQWGPFSEFGAELGLIQGDRRLRLVQLFNRDSQLDRLTLIREQRAGTDAPERPPLTLADLVGDWQGEAITLFPDWRSAETCTTRLQIERVGADRLTQSLSFGAGDAYSHRSTAKINGSVLHFDQGTQAVQVLLLPDGASCTCPVHIVPRAPFFLEIGWLVQPGLRQRLIRRYSSAGEWVSLTLVTEQKIGV